VTFTGFFPTIISLFENLTEVWFDVIDISDMIFIDHKERVVVRSSFVCKLMYQTSNDIGYVHFFG
jgi:hypothetical protein